MTIYFYVGEKAKIKNAYIPILQDDYLTQRLTKMNHLRTENAPLEFMENQIIGDAQLLNDVPLIRQNPDYPNGCEAASATMILNYLKIDITLKEFIDEYLIKGKIYEKDGRRYGPDPTEAFAGDPSDAMYGWGTLAPAIQKSLDDVLNDKTAPVNYKVISNENNLDLSALMALLDEPLIIWTTTDYTPVKEVYQWYSYDGKKTYTYPKNSHTIVVTGCDKDYYYINDPLKNEKNIRIEKEKLEISFDSVGRQAVAILTR